MINSLRSLSALFLVVVFFSSCLKDDPPPPAAGNIMITHASPNAPDLDMYVDAKLAAINISYGTDTGYLQINPGTFRIDFSQADSTRSLAYQTFTFESNKFYSMFVIDSLSKMKLVAMEDVFTAAVNTDSAQVRYLDFSPDAPFHSVTITNGTDSLQYAIRGFNDQSANNGSTAFADLKSGTYDVKLSMPGSSTPFKVFSGIALTGGKRFTLYLKGFYNGTGTQAFGLGKIQHFN